MVATRRLTALERSIEFEPLPDAPVCVALSGGADSAACLWMTVRSGLPVRAVHVHHGLPTSDLMADAATAVAAVAGVALDVVGVDVPEGPSFEAQARRARRRALIESARAGEWLITGHTLDDQVETVLMRIARGAGLDGLAGIPRLRAPFCRPLLGVSRTVTRELATLASLPWRDDLENESARHLRNRVRLRLLPMIEETFGPSFGDSLARTARTAAEEIGVLDALADAVPLERSDGGIRFAVGALVAVPRGVAARVLRRAFVELDPPYPPGRGTIDDLLTMAGSSHSRTVDVTSLLVARRWGPWLEIARSAETIVPEPSRLVLPGTARWGRFVMDATVVERPVPTPGSVWSLLAPAGATLTIRGAVPGDRIEIVGGHKSVLDALADAGVPKHLRSSWPVVEIDGEVAWVPGVRRAVSAGSRADRYLWATVTEDAAWEPYER